MTSVYGPTGGRWRDPYIDFIRPALAEIPTLRGGGRLIQFDDQDRPVLPRFQPASAGEARKVSWFVRSNDDTEWWPAGDEGCSDEYLERSDPHYGTGTVTPDDAMRALRLRRRDATSQLVQPYEGLVRTLTWTSDGRVLRDVQVQLP